MDRVLGGFFRRFNRLFHRGSDAYSGGVQRVIGRKALMLVIYAVLGATWGCSSWCPAACAGPGQAVPGRLCPAARWRHAGPHGRRDPPHGRDRQEQPGVEDAIAFPGLSINGFTNSSNSGIVFVTLKPFAERSADQSGGAAGQLNQAFGHPGSLHRHVPAAAGGRPGHDRRLQAADRGPRLAGL
jgi:multidrug efflux pump